MREVSAAQRRPADVGDVELAGTCQRSRRRSRGMRSRGMAVTCYLARPIIPQPRAPGNRHQASRSRFRFRAGVALSPARVGRAGAPQLVLLHGWMDVSASFQFVVDAFERDWHVWRPTARLRTERGRSGDCYWFPTTSATSIRSSTRSRPTSLRRWSATAWAATSPCFTPACGGARARGGEPRGVRTEGLRAGAGAGTLCALARRAEVAAAGAPIRLGRRGCRAPAAEQSAPRRAARGVPCRALVASHGRWRLRNRRRPGAQGRQPGAVSLARGCRLLGGDLLPVLWSRPPTPTRIAGRRRRADRRPRQGAEVGRGQRALPTPATCCTQPAGGGGAAGRGLRPAGSRSRLRRIAPVMRPASALNADLHSHSTVSDGTCRPARNWCCVRRSRGVELFALTITTSWAAGPRRRPAPSSRAGLRARRRDLGTWAGRTVHVVGLGHRPAQRCRFARAGDGALRPHRAGATDGRGAGSGGHRRRLRWRAQATSATRS